tara:strand:+ start:37 stop:888 length:852 start_codon:yes stop_codon:yes gene_type:complete
MRKFTIDFGSTPFLFTSKTGASSKRLNWRCEMLLTRNKRTLTGSKILDLASHDGRFTYAALKLGAKHVTGVEGKQYLVDNANNNLKKLGYHEFVDYNFICDDLFNYLSNIKPYQFDTILCFGFLYHTTKQVELIRNIKRISPKYFIIDTVISKGLINKYSIKSMDLILSRILKIFRKTRLIHLFKIMSIIIRKLRFPKNNYVNNSKDIKQPYLLFGEEDIHDEGAIVHSSGLVAQPSEGFLEMMFTIEGFKYDKIKWHEENINNWDYIEPYQNGKRLSYIAYL